MSIEANKAIVRRLWKEVWNQNNLSVCDEIFSEEYAAHEKGFIPVLRAAFPDLKFTIQDMIAEGDKVVTRYNIDAADPEQDLADVLNPLLSLLRAEG